MASTSYNQTQSSSITTSLPIRYDVFLSFRGLDTRHTFIDYLYDALCRSGIRTFMDDPELRSGDVISDTLLKAIQESKTYIVVFSENYASSSWCLDELAEILKCNKTTQRLIIPVFYNIEPSVVRRQTGSFEEFFKKHQARIPFDMERLNMWRSTLTDVGGLKGYHVLRNVSQIDIIKKVADRILLEINAMTLDVAKAVDNHQCYDTMLNLSNSQDLTTTPDFTRFPCLETLNLKYCKSLEKVHISIGSLVRLVSLDLHGCVKLRSLPDTICNLRVLKVLDIGDCSSLESLPIELGKIESLTNLNARRLAVSKLPHSIGCLRNLVELILSDNKNLETLPDTICNLRSLEILKIDGCQKLDILPDQLWKITRLRELDARGSTPLRKLPDVESSQIALSLQTLDIPYSALTALPSGFSQLSNLEYLSVEYCFQLTAIAELPPNLKWIWARGCTSLKRLPNLSNLKRLVWLRITDCISLTEIQGLEELTSLREVSLKGCRPSLLAYIFTKPLFQVFSGFGHEVQINDPSEFPDWISQSSEYVSTMSIDFLPNLSHNFLGMILCFKHSSGIKLRGYTYSVKNTTSNFIWKSITEFDQSIMIVVPRSIFPVSDCDSKIEVTSDQKIIFGIHLLYKPENTMIKEYDSITAEVEEERSCPFKRLKHLYNYNNNSPRRSQRVPKPNLRYLH